MTGKEQGKAQDGAAAEELHASTPPAQEIPKMEANESEFTNSDDDDEEEENTTKQSTTKPTTTEEAPPLPEESIPPLPAEPPPPGAEADDGWLPVWEETAQAFYFFNRFTGATQWTNPRVAETAQPGPPGVTPSQSEQPDPISSAQPAGGYDPAIHGDYDPTAWYAQAAEPEAPASSVADPTAAYTATAAFNRFTGRYQAADLVPEKFNDESKSRNQMNAFFNVDEAANSHDGRSLKAERSGKKLSKSELKQFKEKRKAKKEEKRRAWLRD